MKKVIDIRKLERGYFIEVPYNGSYWGATIVGISKKHNTVSVDIGDYARLYHIPIDECKQHINMCYKGDYMENIYKTRLIGSYGGASEKAGQNIYDCDECCTVVEIKDRRCQNGHRLDWNEYECNGCEYYKEEK